MKLIMERWKHFLSEQSDMTPDVRTAAIVWNNPNFRPLDKSLLSKIPNLNIMTLLKNIPQGHSGIIFVSEEPEKNRVKCTSVDFGADPGFCSKEHKKEFLYSLKQKLGIFVGGKVIVRAFYLKGENVIQNLESFLPKIIQKWKKITRSKHTPQEFGIAFDVDVRRGIGFARSKKRCSEYTVIPDLGDSGGDNCGSFALKAAAYSLGKESEAGGVIGTMIGPDGMIQKMQDLDWIDTSFSQDYT